jgi:hypothetical protein
MRSAPRPKRWSSAGSRSAWGSARSRTLSGTLAGIILGGPFLPIGLLIWGDAAVMAAGSGPLATVVQDLLSILIYLGVAMLIVA